jgi:taurine--2-oxoglutarate transaminase
VADRETKTPLVPWNSTGSAARPTQEMAKYLMSKGIMPRIRWSYFNIGPPLITTKDELKWVLRIVDEALSITDEYADKQ